MEFVKEHRIKSRAVTSEDVARIVADAEEMKKLMARNCLAIAHPQVEDKEPLAFFVLSSGNIVVNPVITNHVKYTVDSLEGCMTYPEKSMLVHQRYHRIDVSYQKIVDGKLSDIVTDTISGRAAHVFQHETDHLNSIYCYDTQS